MKSATFLVALALVGASPLAAQDAPAEEMVEARAIIAVMFPPQSRDAQLHAMMTDILKQFRTGMPSNALSTDPGARAILEGYLETVPDTLMPLVRKHFPLMLEATAGAYTREFSLDELRELRRFAITPTGAHYFSRSTALVGDPAVAAANAAYFGELQSLQKIEVEKLKAKLMAYLDDHPEVVKKLSAQGGK